MFLPFFVFAEFQPGHVSYFLANFQPHVSYGHGSYKKNVYVNRIFNEIIQQNVT